MSKQLKSIFLFFLFLYILSLTSPATYPPTWVTSQYMQADSKKIITTKTGNTSTPTGTMPFAVPFSAIPNLGYGITSYEGDDFLYQEMFEVNRTALTTSSFSFLVQIQGITNIWLMEVRYVGIDKTFPHHLNSFDNVPVNYTFGPLVNISTANTNVQTFRNAINYTAQAIANGLTYKTFSTPLTNNKILLFMTSFFVKSTVESGGTVYPLNLNVVANIISTEKYQFYITYSKSSAINRLHFSMIVFDEADVLSSGKYMLVYTRVDFPTTGGFYPFPIEFIKNFMIGFTDFATTKSGSTIHYGITFNTTAPTGAYMTASVPRNSKTPLSRFGFTVFYLKTWYCQDQTFFNTTSNLCEGCPIINCLTCQNLTICKICDASLNYYLNTTTGQCQTCSIVGCKTCSGSTCTLCDADLNYIISSPTCTQCGPNTFANSATNTCDACVLTNCTTCKTLAVCQVCDATLKSYLNSMGTCSYCDPSTNNFLDTATQLTCLQCNLSNCAVCSTLTTCSVCANPNLYLLDTTTYQCSLCPITNCQICTSTTVCAQCNATAGYFPSSPSTCDTCTVPGCILCDSLTTCQTCNISANYYKILPTDTTCTACASTSNLFVNISSNSCQSCTLTNCTTCQTLYRCQTCNYLMQSYLDETTHTCAYCDQSNNYFLDGSHECQQCSIPYCSTCLNLTACSVCNTAIKFYINNTDLLCYPCTVDYCLECSTLYTCQQCDGMALYLLNTNTGQCEQCNLAGCLNCSSLTSCFECDSINGYGFDYTNVLYNTCGTCSVSCTCDGYTTPWDPVLQQCASHCGDGLTRLSQQCDDGNIVNGDGCSSTCQKQRFYVCNTVNQPSTCILNLYIVAKHVAIWRQACNQFVAQIDTDNLLAEWISQYISILNPNISITRITNNGTYIDIHAQYHTDIVNEVIQINFSPGNIVNITYTPTLPPLLYSKQQCNTLDQVEHLLTGIQVISYIILVISILSCKIVGLQLFGVLQLAYFALSAYSYLNVYLQPLNKFKTFNGLNVQVARQEQTQVPNNYREMGLAANFINNCNVMLFVLFAQLIVAVTVYIVSRVLRKYEVQKIALRLLKQGFVTLILFNIFNISFSAGVHWKYADPSDPAYAISSFILYGTLLTMVAAVIAMELTNKQDYGEYKNKFKKVWICQLYIPLTVVYRMVLGFYTAVKSDYDESTLVILGFSLMFMLYMMVNLPFTNVYQNYRCGLIHFTMFFTLLTANYYRSMKSNTPMEVKGRIYTPAVIELVLIVCCIGISSVVLVYQVYQIIRDWRTKRKIQTNQTKPQQQNPHRPPQHITEDSLTYINH